MPAAWVEAAAAVYGAYSASQGSKDANQSEQQAAASAEALQKQMYDQTRADNMPALDARNASLTRLQQLLGVGGDPKAAGYGSLGGPINAGNVQNEPGYKFGMDEGMQGLNNQLAARGMRNSGAALMGANRFATDYATTKYDDAFNREQSNRQIQLNPLQSLAGLGQTGANTMAQAGTNYANQSGAFGMQAGAANAQNALAQGSIWGNAANQFAGWYQNQQKQSQQMPAGYASGVQNTDWYNQEGYGNS